VPVWRFMCQHGWRIKRVMQGRWEVPSTG
jgi:hypothetical protein